MYLYRIHVIIPLVDRTAANAIAADIDPDSGGGETFGDANVSANGHEPGTHILISTAATEAMRGEMLSAFNDWQVNGLSEAPRFWQCDINTDTLQASNVTEATGQTFTVTDVLNAAGLLFVVPDGPQD